MSAGRWIATAAMAAVTLVGGRTLLAQDTTKTLPEKIGDLNAVQVVEIFDQSGQVLLRGAMKTESNTTTLTERKADLVSPTGQKAKGKVAIKIERKDNSVKHEVEVDLSGMPTSMQCELRLDGRQAGTFLTSKQGLALAKFALERKEK